MTLCCTALFAIGVIPTPCLLHMAVFVAAICLVCCFCTFYDFIDAQMLFSNRRLDRDDHNLFYYHDLAQCSLILCLFVLLISRNLPLFHVPRFLPVSFPNCLSPLSWPAVSTVHVCAFLSLLLFSLPSPITPKSCSNKPQGCTTKTPSCCSLA
jgi:hypothetical protein